MNAIKKDHFGEAIARKLSGFAGVPPIEQERMIRSVVHLCNSRLSDAIKALERYAGHDRDCPQSYSGSSANNCDCGFSEALAKLKEDK